MNNNMPNVPVKDLLVHPRDNDLVLGSYGRDFWITNISPLQELTGAVLAEPVHLFAIDPTVQRITWQFAANDYLFGQRHLQTPNQTNGMAIRYYLKSQAPAAPAIVITDSTGREVAKLQGTSTAGINTVVWTMRPQGEGRGGRGGGRGANPLESLAPLGDYTVTLQVGETKLTQPAKITKTKAGRCAVADDYQAVARDATRPAMANGKESTAPGWVPEVDTGVRPCAAKWPDCVNSLA